MSRRFKYRIDVWQHTAVDDGAGGSTQGEVQLGSSWCDIRTLSRYKITDYGLDVEQEAIRIRLRYRSDLDYTTVGIFFRYKSRDWHPKSIERKDLEEYEVEIIVVSNG